MVGMAEIGERTDRFHHVLTSELGQPMFLTQEEVGGAWRETLPSLARCLPAPYPIFDAECALSQISLDSRGIVPIFELFRTSSQGRYQCTTREFWSTRNPIDSMTVSSRSTAAPGWRCISPTRTAIA